LLNWKHGNSNFYTKHNRRAALHSYND